MVPARKAFSALCAGEEFVAPVKLLVGSQTLRPTETLPTVRALTRPHARVLLLMSPQVTRLPEALAALRTKEWLLTCVCAHVYVQLSRVHKTLVALRACVWLHTCVDTLVLLQAVEPVEGLTTVRTQVQLVPLPETGVVFETPDCTKGLGTLRAAVVFGRHVGLAEADVLVGHLWVVAADMLVQVALASEGEGAVAAGVDGSVGKGSALAVGTAARVALLVALQTGRLGEGLEAQRAAVRPLLGMNGAFVSPQVAQAVEIEATVRAAVRTIALLNAVMVFEEMKVAEGSQTFTADVRRGGQLLGLQAVCISSLWFF